MWYKVASEVDKQRPPYEVKVIGMDAEFAIRRLLYLQGNYNPSEAELQSKIKKLISHIENKYGSIANLRLHTKGDTLQEIVAENVNELFGQK